MSLAHRTRLAVASVVMFVACERGASESPAPSADAALAGSTDALPVAASKAAELAPDSSASAPQPSTPEASAFGAASASAALVDPLVITLARSPLTTDFSARPFSFTAAFDGSLRFSLWLRTMQHARAMKKKYGRGPHYTFFVNSAFYTTTPGKSDVGKAMSRDEVLVRRALTQQAINEGHDIGDHGMGHHDGRNWSKDEWLTEFARFHSVMDSALFIPIVETPVATSGSAATIKSFVFPKFEPLAGAAKGELGAACESDSDCVSQVCAAVSESVGLCSQPCNLKAKCPTGTACGAPMFRENTDLCLVVPRYPVMLDGKVLFDSRGEPNLKHPRLASYPIVGFRAPYLAANNALYDALAERGYHYDTSQSASPGPPYWLTPPTAKPQILEFALMLYPDVAAIPMDYNYAKLKVSRARMESDYHLAIEGALAKGNVPFNVGHHFAMWEDGAYLAALEATVEYVLAGCPDALGAIRCKDSEVPSFRELEQRLTQGRLE